MVQGRARLGAGNKVEEIGNRRKCRVESLPAAVVNIDVDTTNSRQKASYRLLHTHTPTHTPTHPRTHIHFTLDLWVHAAECVCERLNSC